MFDARALRKQLYNYRWTEESIVEKVECCVGLWEREEILLTDHWFGKPKNEVEGNNKGVINSWVALRKEKWC